MVSFISFERLIVLCMKSALLSLCSLLSPLLQYSYQLRKTCLLNTNSSFHYIKLVKLHYPNSKLKTFNLNHILPHN